MTEDDARGLMTERFGSARVERIAVFLDMVVAENDQQNLIAPSTIDTIWVRHALDSAQLMFHVEHRLSSSESELQGRCGEEWEEQEGGKGKRIRTHGAWPGECFT